jgi:hypothetical protein
MGERQPGHAVIPDIRTNDAPALFTARRVNVRRREPAGTVSF